MTTRAANKIHADCAAILAVCHLAVILGTKLSMISHLLTDSPAAAVSQSIVARRWLHAYIDASSVRRSPLVCAGRIHCWWHRTAAVAAADARPVKRMPSPQQALFWATRSIYRAGLNSDTISLIQVGKLNGMEYCLWKARLDELDEAHFPRISMAQLSSR